MTPPAIATLLIVLCCTGCLKPSCSVDDAAASLVYLCDDAPILQADFLTTSGTVNCVADAECRVISPPGIWTLKLGNLYSSRPVEVGTISASPTLVLGAATTLPSSATVNEGDEQTYTIEAVSGGGNITLSCPDADTTFEIEITDRIPASE